MNFSASVPVADMQAANNALEAAGFGPDNFSVPSYAGPSPAYAVLHCWSNSALESTIEGIPSAVIVHNVNNPIASTDALPGDWSGSAQPLEGVVVHGLYYDAAGVLWWVIQAYDTAVYPDPLLVPALIRLAKVPGKVLPWQQPLDQYDAYKIVNPFTGSPDECYHDGKHWRVSEADGAGNNIWEPGVFGWSIINGA